MHKKPRSVEVPISCSVQRHRHRQCQRRRELRRQGNSNSYASMYFLYNSYAIPKQQLRHGLA